MCQPRLSVDLCPSLEKPGISHLPSCTSSTVAVLSCMLTTVPAILAAVPAVLAPVAAIAAVARVNRLGLRRSAGSGSGGILIRRHLSWAGGGGDLHTAGGTWWIVSAADFLRRDRSTLSRVGFVANVHKIGTALLVEHVEPTYTPIQVHHQAIAIIVLGAVQVHAGTRCQVDCGLVARALSSGTRSCRNIKETAPIRIMSKHKSLPFFRVYPCVSPNFIRPISKWIAITSHYIPLYTSQQTSHFIPLTTTSRYRGKHPMTHGVNPFPAPFPLLLLLYLQPRNHIRKRPRNSHWSWRWSPRIRSHPGNPPHACHWPQKWNCYWYKS